jgi:L-alanine-DL-glutamate epimerase-like enolase superfamily enzyme
VSKITKVEVHEFDFEAENLARDGVAQTLTYRRGARIRIAKYAVVIETADGLRGEYVTHWVGLKSALAQTLMLAPRLIGKDARERIAVYEDFKRDIRQFDHMGHGPIDIALWDWAGKRYNAPISELLGGYRKRLPAYASTYHADRAGGLSSKEAFVDFARRCHEIGYRAFKIHGWNDGNAREEAENVLHMAREMGSRMTLMLDPACELRTFADALYVGRACDEGGYFWYEDPYRDSGVSAFGHRRLRALLKTPLLITEHVRGVEPKADFVLAGGTDFLRVDPEYDMGITGSLKIAHLAESLGLDVEIHACGPAHRHLMSALRNSNYYEVALLGPDCPNAVPPVYACGYTDQIDCVDSDGTVAVPVGPGLGVSYDWDFIDRNRLARHVFE